MRHRVAVLVFCLAVPSVAAAAQEIQQGPACMQWSELPPLPDPLGFAGPFAGVSNGALIVAGGANFPDGHPWDGHPKVWHDRVFVLTDPGGPWRQIGHLPQPLAYGVSLTASGGVVCAGGGDKDSHRADVFLLKWADGQIQVVALPPMPKPAAFFCGALLGQTLYVAGGLEHPASTATLRTFWSLNLTPADGAMAWKELEPWPGRPRMLAAAAVQGGDFFLFSGVDLVAGKDGKPAREYLKDAYRYTPGKGWKRIADLPYPAAAAPSPAPSLGQSHILLLGGDDGHLAARVEELKDRHPGFSADTLAYHTITDTWTKMGGITADAGGGDTAGQPDAGIRPPVTTVATWWGNRLVVPSGEVRPGVRTPRVLAADTIPRTLRFGWLNYAVLALYLLAMAAMGPYFSRREKTTRDFFLGGRRIPWWAAGLSIFGTQLSAITYMAIPAMSYRTDWVYFLGNMMIVAAAPLVIWVYLPFFRRLDVTSAYEYLEKRFNLAARLLGSAAFILFQLGRLGVVIYLPALAIATIMGVNVYYSIIAMGLVTTLYTMLGGIEAVTWTDVVQVVVLLGAALLSLVLVIAGVEGGLSTTLSMAFAENKFRAVNWNWDIASTALWVVIVGKFLEQLVPYTSDQAVVQRYLTTRDERQAARSIWTNAVLTIPASLLFFGLGTGLWAFYKTHPHLLNPVARTDDIFPWFMAQQLPAGISGLAVAGLFAAAMSTLSGSMNSMATAITTDFYRRLKSRVSDRECLNFARALTLLLGAAGTVSAMYLAALHGISIWDQYIKILGLCGGGLAGLFVAGIFTRRTHGAGAVVGFFASAVVLYLVSSSGVVHFFLYAAVGILSCVVVGWLASLPGSRAPKNLDGLTIYSMKRGTPK